MLEQAYYNQQINQHEMLGQEIYRMSCFNLPQVGALLYQYHLPGPTAKHNLEQG